MTTFLNKNRVKIGWVLSVLLGGIFIMSSMQKFMGDEMMVSNFAKWGLTGWITIIAIGELISALLFIFPKTNFYGVLLLSSYMGGAILVHMANGEPFWLPQVLFLVLIWVIGYIRNPNSFPKLT